MAFFKIKEAMVEVREEYIFRVFEAIFNDAQKQVEAKIGPYKNEENWYILFANYFIQLSDELEKMMKAYSKETLITNPNAVISKYIGVNISVFMEMIIFQIIQSKFNSLSQIEEDSVLNDEAKALIIADETTESMDNLKKASRTLLEKSLEIRTIEGMQEIWNNETIH